MRRLLALTRTAQERVARRLQLVPSTLVSQASPMLALGLVHWLLAPAWL
jgi:hypothetical protein